MKIFRRLDPSRSRLCCIQRPIACACGSRVRKDTVLTHRIAYLVEENWYVHGIYWLSHLPIRQPEK